MLVRVCTSQRSTADLRLGRRKACVGETHGGRHARCPNATIGSRTARCHAAWVVLQLFVSS